MRLYALNCVYVYRRGVSSSSLYFHPTTSMGKNPTKSFGSMAKGIRLDGKEEREREKNTSTSVAKVFEMKSLRLLYNLRLENILTFHCFEPSKTHMQHLQHP